jgi:glycosyltransferase involved in cell wall biosynthesis
MKENQLTLSIVIPAYNEEHHLRACLDSIARQTILPDEVIVVDNNSYDRTAEIARSYPFAKIVRETHQGLVHARNRGFNVATSDIIGRIDADTVLPRTWVEHIKAFYIDSQNMQTAWSGSGYFYNVRLPRLVAWAYQFMAFHFNKVLLSHYVLWGSNMALPRQCWLAVRAATCSRNDIHEDLDLSIHVAEAGLNITYDPTQPVRAKLRRVNVDRHQLWEYLQWWPNTLRIHNRKSWTVCWFFGAFLLYMATFILLALNVVSPALERLLMPLSQKPPKTSHDYPQE